jgi:hypothetical protein
MDTCRKFFGRGWLPTPLDKLTRNLSSKAQNLQTEPAMLLAYQPRALFKWHVLVP